MIQRMSMPCVVGVVSGLALGLVASSSMADVTVAKERIGTSAGSRPVEVLTVGGPDSGDRPALLIVAGMQGHRVFESEVARALAERLAGEHAGLLDGRTVYIIAEANPDGAGAWSDGSGARGDWGRAAATLDHDGDGRTNEDPGEDLNGDGWITVMRVPTDGSAAAAGYGLEATHVIDGDDARIMRKPVSKDGERATHAILVEGTDLDGDGAFSEDGEAGASGGGVDFDRHWPTHWPEHTDGAGLFPLERPASRAITEWVQSRTNIVAVLVYGQHDTLGAVPKSGAHGAVGRVSTGIEKDDADAWGAVSDLYKETTGVAKASGDADRDGSFLQWAYADLGVYAFGAPAWVRADLMKSGDGEKKADAPASPEDAQARAMELAVERDKASMAERGVPAELIAFIYMTEAERAEQMRAYEDAGPEGLAQIMQTVRRQPMDVQQRLMALGQGNADPHPPEVTAEDRAAAGMDDATPGGTASRKKKTGDSDEAKWLSWMDDAGVEGFVDWQPFDHPQLGAVEIGGFVPGARINPPEDQRAGVIDRQEAFVAGLLGMLPRLDVQTPTVDRVGNGLWRVSVSASNAGRLDTVPASGQKARRLPGLVFAFDPERVHGREVIASGDAVTRFEAVPGSGGSVRAEWLVALPEGETVRVQVRSPRFGDREFDVKLTDGGAS